MVPSWLLNAKLLIFSSSLLVLMLGACGGDSDTPVSQAAPTSVPVAVAAATSAPQVAASKQGGELRIGMTAADIPLTDIQADQGFEGWRFVGFQLNNGLTTWDWNGETIPGPAPGLA